MKNTGYSFHRIFTARQLIFEGIIPLCLGYQQASTPFIQSHASRNNLLPVALMGLCSTPPTRRCMGYNHILAGPNTDLQGFQYMHDSQCRCA